MSKLLVVALVAVLAVSAVMADTCGGNCPSDDCGSCPCGTSGNGQDPGTWCSQFAGWDQGQCQCIMNAESGGNGNAMNQNTDGSFDVGLWQVNTQNWASCSGGSPPCDPSTNLGCAIDVWRWGGGTFKLWSTCGGCGACSVSGVTQDWDGSFPLGYDSSRPFPPFAVKTADKRIGPK